MERYCPQCESVLIMQSSPVVTGRCSKCDWTGGPGDFLSEFKTSTKASDARWAPYVSIDLETTGLDENFCQVLEFGAVIDDWHTPIEQLPRFRKYVRQSYIHGQPYALALNHEILRKLSSNDPAIDAQSCTEEKLGFYFAGWLRDHDIDPMHVSAAGKNFAGFDLQFLKRVPGFLGHVHFKHRAIDPAVFYWRPDTDDCLPNMKTCLERADLDDHVSHTAVEDCISVIQLVRHGTRKCKLFVSGRDPA